MKVFLSALEQNTLSKSEGSTPLAKYLVDCGVPLRWNLMSYFYLRGKNEEIGYFIRDHSEEVMIDSGAHSFQKGKKVDWVEYTKEYAEFIRRFDNPKVIGYFEMDVDQIIGYENVLELRKILEAVTDKIIPVWHKERGIDEFKKMCQEYQGKIVAITGFKNLDIKEHQYMMFLKYAKKYNCKVHCLGMTRKGILKEVPFDYVDSSSWSHYSFRGEVWDGLQEKVIRKNGIRKVTREVTRKKTGLILKDNYLSGVQMQKRYYKLWRNVCKD